jgi:hypothetical protein
VMIEDAVASSLEDSPQPAADESKSGASETSTAHPTSSRCTANAVGSRVSSSPEPEPMRRLTPSRSRGGCWVCGGRRVVDAVVSGLLPGWRAVERTT